MGGEDQTCKDLSDLSSLRVMSKGGVRSELRGWQAQVDIGCFAIEASLDFILVQNEKIGVYIFWKHLKLCMCQLLV